MKPKPLVIFIIIFFIIVNSIGSWEGKLGIFAFPLFIALFICYVLLFILFVRQLFLLAKEKLADKQRLITSITLALVLTLTFFKPHGLINFDDLRGKNLLIADYEGAGSCNSTLKFKENNKFVNRDICFGIDEITGTYYRKGDTLFFQNIEPMKIKSKYSEFAIIKTYPSPKGIYVGQLILYKNRKDTTGSRFQITTNKFKSN